MTNHAPGAENSSETGHRPTLRDAQILQKAIRESISTSPEAFLKTVDDVDERSIDYWEKEIDTSTWAVIQRGEAVVGIAVARLPDREMDTDIDPTTARFIESVWITPNTTYLRRAGFDELVTWDFAMVWRRGGAPGRRWVTSPRRLRSPLCVLICLPSLMQAGRRSSRLPGLRRGRWWCGLLACGFTAGRPRWRVTRRRRASWRCSAARW